MVPAAAAGTVSSMQHHASGYRCRAVGLKNVCKCPLCDIVRIGLRPVVHARWSIQRPLHSFWHIDCRLLELALSALVERKDALPVALHADHSPVFLPGFVIKR